MERGIAEHLEILLRVATDLAERVYKWRTDLAAAVLSDLWLSDKVVKRLTDKFPQLVDALKEKEQGYDTFMNNAHAIESHFTPFFTLIGHCLEFRDSTLVLIHEVSQQLRHTLLLTA